MELTILIAAVLVAIPLWFLAVVNWKRFQHDRQRHDEALLERTHRKLEENLKKAERRQENVVNRLFSAVSQAAIQKQFSPEVVRITRKDGWDGVELRLHSTTAGQIGNPFASAFVRCSPKGDEIVLNFQDYTDPVRIFRDISHLEQVVAALIATFTDNRPEKT